MTKKERKALAVVLYALGEIHCGDPRYREVVTRLADLLAGAEEEKEPNYVPTVPCPYSPWDWWEGFRPKTPVNPTAPGDTPPYTYGPSDGIPGQTFYSAYTTPINERSCEHRKKTKKEKKD